MLGSCREASPALHSRALASTGTPGCPILTESHRSTDSRKDIALSGWIPQMVPRLPSRLDKRTRPYRCPQLVVRHRRLIAPLNSGQLFRTGTPTPTAHGPQPFRDLEGCPIPARTDIIRSTGFQTETEQPRTRLATRMPLENGEPDACRIRVGLRELPRQTRRSALGNSCDNLSAEGDIPAPASVPVVSPVNRFWRGYRSDPEFRRSTDSKDIRLERLPSSGGISPVNRFSETISSDWRGCPIPAGSIRSTQTET